MKKGKKVGHNKSQKSALSGAIRDLETEIKRLNKEKNDLKRSVSSTSSAIEGDREQEKVLQQKIARLLEREAKLNQKKKNLQGKIDKLSDKVGKISKIRSEMSDV